MKYLERGGVEERKGERDGKERERERERWGGGGGEREGSLPTIY